MVAQWCEQMNPCRLGHCERGGALQSVRHYISNPPEVTCLLTVHRKPERRFSMAGCLPPQTRQRQRSPNPTQDFLSSGLPGATLGLAQGPVPGADAPAGKMEDNRQIMHGGKGQTEPGGLAGQVPGRLHSGESSGWAPRDTEVCKSLATSNGCCPPGQVRQVAEPGPLGRASHLLCAVSRSPGSLWIRGADRAPRPSPTPGLNTGAPGAPR